MGKRGKTLLKHNEKLRQGISKQMKVLNICKDLAPADLAEDEVLLQTVLDETINTLRLRFEKILGILHGSPRMDHLELVDFARVWTLSCFSFRTWLDNNVERGGLELSTLAQRYINKQNDVHILLYSSTK
jgi:hypothetical protein